MKKLMLLSTSLCYFIAAVAMAAEVPGSKPASSPQTPLAGKASGVSEGIPAAKMTSPNAYTVEELYKSGEELNKKKVVVHGTVVKVTSGIMGKNWTHIQDGTGDPKKGTNDIICISAIDRAELGQVVTITGTVTYNPASRYKLIIEDATINR